MQRNELEAALDKGLVWVAMANGNNWRLRRNGKTQTWKTRPDEFRIPVKAGLKATGQLTHDSIVEPYNNEGEFLVTVL